MKGDAALNNLKNAKEYIILLPINEQIKEIDRMIKCHSDYNHPRVQVKKKYALKSLIKYYLQQIRDDTSIAKSMPALHETLAC